jgi:hypothetical protein
MSTRLDLLKKNSKLNSAKAQSLKVLLNAVSGRMGNQGGVLEDFDSYADLILLGQAYLLQLIDLITCNGGRVLYANTDGLIVKMQKNIFKAITNKWWKLTSLQLKIDELRCIYLTKIGPILVRSDNTSSIPSVVALSDSRVTESYNFRRVLPPALYIALHYYIFRSKVQLPSVISLVNLHL